MGKSGDRTTETCLFCGRPMRGPVCFTCQTRDGARLRVSVDGRSGRLAIRAEVLEGDEGEGRTPDDDGAGDG